MRSRPPVGFLAVVAGLGAATMVVELAAVRLLAPWFGASSGVWTNVIGVILLGLALGYLAGARLAVHREPERALAWILAGAGLLILGVPLEVAPVGRWFLPADVALHEAAGLVAWGSLATTAVIFLPMSTALGSVGPLAVEILQRRTGSHAGTAGGRVLAASTLGSLAGTFATTHALVPGLGLARTFGAAAALALLGSAYFALAALRARRSHGARGALAVALGLGALALARPPAPAGPALAAGVELLAASESAYQSVRAVESEQGGEPLRLLQVNEGFDSFQSAWRPAPGLLGEGYYYDLFALPTWWDAERRDWRVLVLGLGAGSAVRVLNGAAPSAARLEFDGIEIDPEVVRLGREYFDLARESDARVRVHASLDARVALHGLAGPFDFAILDAYAHQVEIPAHLASLEFFESVRARLAPGGWLAVNVGGFDFADPVVRAIAATLAAAFEGPVLALRVPQARNYVLFARQGAELALPPWTLAPELAEPERRERARALAAPLELDGAWRLVEPGRAAADLLTDDHSPLERLQAESLRAARAARLP